MAHASTTHMHHAARLLWLSGVADVGVAPWVPNLQPFLPSLTPVPSLPLSGGGAQGLWKCHNTRIGTNLLRGVSGGERKRTSIGMELVVDPIVLCTSPRPHYPPSPPCHVITTVIAPDGTQCGTPCYVKPPLLTEHLGPLQQPHNMQAVRGAVFFVR